MAELNKAARNERRKLTGTYVNGLAIAVAAIGTFTQLLIVIQQMAGGASSPSWVTFVIIAVCIIASYGIHLLARMQLAGMEE